MAYNPLNLDFTGPKVVRGRLTNERTLATLQFGLNPTSIKVTQGANLAEDMIPGSSDPIARWMSGKGTVLSFQIVTDGEINLRTLGLQMGNGSNTVETAPRTWGAGPGQVALATDQFSYDISGTLEFLDQFMNPVDPSLPGANGGPDRVVLSFGAYLRRVICVVHDLEHDITEWSPDLAPVKATTTIKLRVYETKSTYAHLVWTEDGSDEYKGGRRTP